MHRHLAALRWCPVLVGIACVAFSGCAAAAGRSAAPVSTEQAAAATLAVLPVDDSLQAVSISNPGADAAKALELCGVADLHDAQSTPPNSAIADYGQVAGMALVGSARNVGRYMPTYGTEPELQTDQPAWVIQFKGPIFTRGGMRPNLTCVVIGNSHILYDAFGDNAATPAPGVKPPSLALPSLTP
jgi:hypothetical protein